MTVQVREELNAFDLLLQGHREVESLFREFEHLQTTSGHTARVIENACAELGIHDALETGIFYAAVREAADDDAIHELLDDARDAHDNIRTLIGEIRQAPAGERDACFARLAARVEEHVLAEEAALFPRVGGLERLDLAAVTAAMKKRSTSMMSDIAAPATAAETA